MSATREAAIDSALKKIRELYPDAKVTDVFESRKLEEFPGRTGFKVWISADDKLFGPTERPIEVDGETLEARIPYEM